jgi:hypothetical protein
MPMPDTTPSAPCSPPPTRPREVAIVLGWLAATVLAFGWHGPHAWSAGGAPPVVADFDPATQPAAAQWLAARPPAAARHARTLTLLHLREPDCRCNAEADPQVAALRSRYAARGVEIVTLAPGRLPGPPATTATPAAALLDADGTLLYLGPVADTASCAGGTTPLQRALDHALAGAPAEARPMLTTGCFCT